MNFLVMTDNERLQSEVNQTSCAHYVFSTSLSASTLIWPTKLIKHSTTSSLHNAHLPTL